MNNKIMAQALDLVRANKQNALIAKDKAMEQLSQLPEYISLHNLQAVLLARTLSERSIALLDELKTIDGKIDKLAFQHGVIINNYTCTACNDTGELPDGKRCQCLMNIYRQLLQDSFDCGKPLENATFGVDKLALSAQHDMLSLLHDKCRNYVDNYPNSTHKILMFAGSTGVGKSYLISAMANAFISKGLDINYTNAFMLGQKLLQHHLGKLGDDGAFVKDLYTAPILFIDDLGSEQIYNNVTVEYLKNILDERKNLCTIITTNLNPNSTDMLNRYGDRVCSRLRDKNISFCVYIKGDDIRLQK